MDPRPAAARLERRARPRVRPASEEYLEYVGIPRQLHTLEGLKSFFPAAFKIELAPFELDVMADVLVHLIKSGIIKPPR